MKYITLISIIIISFFVYINRDLIISKYSGSNLAVVNIGSGSNSGSYSSSYQSGSVSASFSGSGSASFSGSGSQSIIVLDKTYLANLNVYVLNINNIQKLDYLYSKIKLNSGYDKNDFYNYAKNQISTGSVIDIYLDKVNIPNESIGLYDNLYLNKGFIVRDTNCATASYFKPTNNIVLAGNKTPKIDSMTKGICSVLSTAHSVNTTLKLNPPSGMATSTIVNGKLVWNKEYLEWLAKNINVKNGGIVGVDILNLYKNYISKFKTRVWTNIPVVFQMLTAWLNKQAEIKNKLDFNEIMTLFYKKKTDCSIINAIDLGNSVFSHISHIKNIYVLNGKKYIEVTNTLEQGDDKHNNVPVNPGTTTLVIEDDGSVKVSHHSKEVSKSVRASWESVLFRNTFGIMCVSIE